MRHGWLSARGRVLARVGLGVLTWVVTPSLVDEAVGDGLAWEMRLRALPARVGVYFVLGLCLFSGEPYPQVLRLLTAGLEGPLAAAGWRVPVSRALTGARRRVGERPLESLFRGLAGAVSPGRERWSHLGGLLVAAWDGTCVAVADSEQNAAAFGRASGGSRKKDKDQHEPARDRASVYPQARVVTLVACGTRALLGAVIGPLRGKGSGERALAASLLASLHAGMLLLADRGFYSWQLWADAAATGADLLWRVTEGAQALRLPVARELPDGSWLSRVADPADPRSRSPRDRKKRKDGTPRRDGSQAARLRRLRGEPPPPPPAAVTVRVIGFLLAVTGDDGRVRTERYRLITTLLDHEAFPAADLARCYARRWSAELSYREVKACLRGPGRVLRGRTPDLARQEIWAYLALYQAIRVIIARAAARDGLDPARISFTAALHAARRTITTARHDMNAALHATEAEILSPAALLPERQGRIYPRAAKKRTAAYPPARRTRPISQHATYTITITTTTTTTPQPTHQQKQPPQRQANPP